MTEEEFIFADRIAKIKSINKDYDLNGNSYISFSGGKDSTVLHYLIDEALPGNNIPRVFMNTGIEYRMIVSFVQNMQKTDSRIQIIHSGQNIKTVLEQNGYPFKSKEHSHLWECWKKGQKSKWILNYLKEGDFSCPKSLKYQFTPDFNLNLSDKCCYKLKKEPFRVWEKQNGKTVAILGVRMDEGGQRANHHECIVMDSKGGLNKFKPLNPVSDEWEDWYIKSRNINLCELYKSPFNFKRTGCKGCPFSLDLEEQLFKMKILLPEEEKQCEIIWKPIYDEYRRIGYRLKQNDGQMKLF